MSSETWQQIQKDIQGHIGSHLFNLWIKPVEFVDQKADCFILAAPNPFIQKRIRDKYLALIQQAVNKKAGNHVRVFVEQAPKKQLSKSSSKNPAPHLQRKDQTFDSFVVAENNDLAYSASMSLASKKSTNINALFLLSKPGLGKTHLSRAIGYHVLAECPTDRVFYITADDFSGEMVRAFRDNAIEEFKRKYRNKCDVLLLEDVHHLSGKQRTQIELALTFDSLFDAGKRIIFSSCYLPADIPRLSDHLRSRLNVGIVSEISPPAFNARVRILEFKSKTAGVYIPAEVIQYLAQDLTEDIRQLESGLVAVMARHSLTGQDITLSAAESVVRTISRRREVTLDIIKKFICRHFNLGEDDLVSPIRRQNIVQARRIAMYLARIYTDLPLQQIGNGFNRTHSATIHAITCAERKIRDDENYKNQVAFLCKKIDEGKT